MQPNQQQSLDELSSPDNKKLLSTREGSMQTLLEHPGLRFEKQTSEGALATLDFGAY